MGVSVVSTKQLIIRSFLIAFVFLMTSYLYSPGQLLAQSGGYIITVDGLNFVSTFTPITQQRDSILKPSLEAMNIPDTTIIDMNWSPYNATTQSTAAIKELTDLLVSTSKTAAEKNKKFIVVAHSWGTFLSRIALGYASQSPQWQGCDLFITLGSPLGARQTGLLPVDQIADRAVSAYVDRIKNVVTSDPDFGSITSPAMLGRWVNYWCWSDIISGPMIGSGWDAGSPVEDHVADEEYEGVSRSALDRSLTNVPLWHEYDSLDLDSLYDNTKLRSVVHQEILNVLAGPGVVHFQLKELSQYNGTIKMCGRLTRGNQPISYTPLGADDPIGLQCTLDFATTDYDGNFCKVWENVDYSSVNSGLQQLNLYLDQGDVVQVSLPIKGEDAGYIWINDDTGALTVDIGQIDRALGYYGSVTNALTVFSDCLNGDFSGIPVPSEEDMTEGLKTLGLWLWDGTMGAAEEIITDPATYALAIGAFACDVKTGGSCSAIVGAHKVSGVTVPLEAYIEAGIEHKIFDPENAEIVKNLLHDANRFISYIVTLPMKGVVTATEDVANLLAGTSGIKVVGLWSVVPNDPALQPMSSWTKATESTSPSGLIMIAKNPTGHLVMINVGRKGLSAPILESPPSGSEMSGDTVRVSWNPVSGATHYDINISGTGGGQLRMSADYTAAELSPLQPGGEYLWKVRAVTDDLEGPWSEEWTFTIAGTSTTSRRTEDSKHIMILPVR